MAKTNYLIFEKKLLSGGGPTSEAWVQSEAIEASTARQAASKWFATRAARDEAELFVVPARNVSEFTFKRESKPVVTVIEGQVTIEDVLGEAPEPTPVGSR